MKARANRRATGTGALALLAVAAAAVAHGDFTAAVAALIAWIQLRR
jgi:hypothetical protein